MRVAAVPMALLMVPMLLLAACRGSDDGEAPLVIDAVSPAAAQAILAEAQAAGLTARDATGHVVPGLARSWRVADDGLSIVFRLREAHFAGGRKITSDDVAQTIERARRGGAGALTHDLLAGVTAVNAPLPDVVELILSTPQPELLELLATPPLSIRADGRRPGGAGPYVLKSPANAETDARLARNPDYFAAATVAIGQITVGTRPPEAALQRFTGADSLLVLGGMLDGFASARVSSRRDMMVPSSPRAMLLLLVNYRHGKLADQRVRRALTLAIDRAALGPALFGSQAAVPLVGLTPAGIEGWQPAAPAWAAMPLVARQLEARRLLAAAGVDPLIERLKLGVLADRDAGTRRLMEMVAGNLAAIGVDVVLLQAPPAERAKLLGSGEFDLALVRRESPIDSLIPFLGPFRCARNRHGVCLPEADKLLDASWQAPTLAERVAALAAAERLWADDGAAIGLVQPIDWAMVSPRIEGFAANAAGVHPLRLLRISAMRGRFARGEAATVVSESGD